jgi:hypothetical protein
MAVAASTLARSGLPPVRYRRSRIRDVAEARGLRLPWLAREMRISRSYLHMLLTGQRPYTPAVVAAACRALALPESALFYDPE